MDQITYTSRTQAEADRQAGSVIDVLQWVGIAFIFLPLLTTGYAVSRMKMFIVYSIWSRIAIVLAVAFVIFFLLQVIRQWIIHLKDNHNILWVPIFLACITYTCLFTPWLLHDGLSALFARWHWSPWTELIVDAVIVVITYIPYDFLGILNRE